MTKQEQFEAIDLRLSGLRNIVRSLNYRSKEPAVHRLASSIERELFEIQENINSYVQETVA